MTLDHFPYILHYFIGEYQEKELKKTTFYDEILKSIHSLILLPNIIGYNYIERYEDLVICSEEETYIAKSWQPKQIAECGVYSNGICLSCVSLKQYLMEFGICNDQCAGNIYADDYLKECRPCHSDCATCFGRESNNCLSCKTCDRSNFSNK